MKYITTNNFLIEYDDTTKEKAIKLQKLIEENPFFFKTFLTSNKISFIDKNYPIYIRKNDSILNHLDTISTWEAQFTLSNSFEEDLQQAILLHLLEEKPKDMISKKMAAITYYKTKNNYEGLKEYLKEETEEKNKEILTWLEEKIGLKTLEYLLQKLLNSIKINLVIEEKDLKKKIEEIEKITIEEVEVNDYFLQPVKNTKYYPMSKEESIALCKEFLSVIDPTLTWTKIFTKIIRENKIIEKETDPRINRLVIKPYWECRQKQDGTWYIYAPFQNNIFDVIRLSHEFMHYLGCNSGQYKELSEFPSILIERQLYRFLIKKGYPMEAIKAHLLVRRQNTMECANEVLGLTDNLKSIIDNKEITISSQIEQLKKLNITKPKNISYKTLVIRESINKIKEIQKSESPFLESVSYIVGNHYARIVDEKLQTDKTLYPAIIDITENIESLTTSQVLEKLNLLPDNKIIKGKENVYEKRMPHAEK